MGAINYERAAPQRPADVEIAAPSTKNLETEPIFILCECIAPDKVASVSVPFLRIAHLASFNPNKDGMSRSRSVSHLMSES
jgi:hypothetical protein